MARQTIVKLIDDIDGSIADETVTFGLDGKWFEVDLNTEHGKQLRDALAPFVAAGRKVGGNNTRNITSARSYMAGRHGSPSESANREENGKIREWATANGFTVHPRGRVPVKVLEAYHNRDRTVEEKTVADREVVAEHQDNRPKLATPEGQKVAEVLADEILADDSERKAEAKAGRAVRAAKVSAPKVEANPFTQPAKPKRHARAACEDLDNCPQHGAAARAVKGKASA